MGGYVNRTKIAQLYADAESLGGQTVTVAGWVKSIRDMKNFGFVTLNAGSCFRDLQGGTLYYCAGLCSRRRKSRRFPATGSYVPAFSKEKWLNRMQR